MYVQFNVKSYLINF